MSLLELLKFWDWKQSNTKHPVLKCPISKWEFSKLGLQLSLGCCQGEPFQTRPKACTANLYSQMAVEVHWKTCLLSKSTVLWLQCFYKYFIVLVVNNNCYYCRYFNAFANASKGKCKVQLITAIWNTGKWTQILQGKAVHFTVKYTLFLLRRKLSYWQL